MKEIRWGVYTALTALLVVIFMSAAGLLNTKNIVTAEQPQFTYIVEDGDSLWLVAIKLKSYYPSDDIRDIVTEIRRLNNIADPSSLQIGQELILPKVENMEVEYE